MQPPKVVSSFPLANMPEFLSQQSAHDEAVRLAEAFIATQNEVRPLFIVVSESVLNKEGPTVLFVRTDWEDETEKATHLWAMRKAMKQYNTTRYCFMCEVWVSAYEENELDDPERLPPSARPNARDALLVLTCEKGRDPLSTVYEVKYDTSGKEVVKTLVMAEEQYKDGKLTGNLTGLLNE